MLKVTSASFPRPWDFEGSVFQYCFPLFSSIVCGGASEGVEFFFCVSSSLHSYSVFQRSSKSVSQHSKWRWRHCYFKIHMTLEGRETQYLAKEWQTMPQLRWDRTCFMSVWFDLSSRGRPLPPSGLCNRVRPLPLPP